MTMFGSKNIAGKGPASAPQLPAGPDYRRFAFQWAKSRGYSDDDAADLATDPATLQAIEAQLGGNQGAPPVGLKGAPMIGEAGADPRNHVPDYEGHYRMHGLGPDGRAPRRKGGKLGRIIRGIGEFSTGMLAAQGDPMAQWRYRQMLQQRGERREARQTSQAELAEHNRIVGAMLRQGMNRDQAELAATNLERFGAEYNTRFRTDTAPEGHTRDEPGLDGTYKRRTNPFRVQHGADVMVVDPESPPDGGAPSQGHGPPVPAGGERLMMGRRGRSISLPPAEGQAPPMAGPPPSARRLGQPRGSYTISMRSEAEQFADTIAPRGSPGWRQAVMDYALKAQGPTAVAMNESDNATTRYGVDTRARVDSENNVRTTQTARDTNAATVAAARDNAARAAAQSGRNARVSATGGRRNLVGKKYKTPDGRIIQYDTNAEDYVTVGSVR